jgi:hypothetical protein
LIRGLSAPTLVSTLTLSKRALITANNAPQFFTEVMTSLTLVVVGPVLIRRLLGLSPEFRMQMGDERRLSVQLVRGILGMCFMVRNIRPKIHAIV